MISFCIGVRVATSGQHPFNKGMLLFMLLIMLLFIPLINMLVCQNISTSSQISLFGNSNISGNGNGMDLGLNIKKIRNISTGVKFRRKLFHFSLTCIAVYKIYWEFKIIRNKLKNNFHPFYWNVTDKFSFDRPSYVPLFTKGLKMTVS